MTLATAQALYRERYSAPLRDGEPDLVAALKTERRVSHGRIRYRCACCDRWYTSFGGLCMHLRGAAHVAALTGFGRDEVVAGLEWIR